MAAKKYYFGVGGGTRRFLSVVEKDGELVLTYAIIFMLDCYSDSLYVMCLEVA